MTRRVFLAINLPKEITNKLGPVVEDLKKLNPDYGIKWVALENFHLTLHFFGDLEGRQIEVVGEGINEITKHTPPFKMTTGNFGCFPNEQSPHVFFLSTENSKIVHTLIGELEVMLGNLGYEVDPRPWQGHLTLGRIKEWSRCKINNTKILPMTFTVKSIDLMESELTPDGPIYSVLKSFPLK